VDPDRRPERGGRPGAVALLGCSTRAIMRAARSLQSKRSPEEVWNVISNYAGCEWHKGSRQSSAFRTQRHEVCGRTDRAAIR